MHTQCNCGSYSNVDEKVWFPIGEVLRVAGVTGIEGGGQGWAEWRMQGLWSNAYSLNLKKSNGPGGR